MLKHPELTRKRIERFLAETLRAQMWAQQVPLQAEVFQPTGKARDYREWKIAPTEAANYEYTPVEPEFAWGPVWSDAWFRFTGAVPEGWKGKAVVARIDCGAESILWDGDDPVQGLDAHHGDVMLFRSAQGGEDVTLTVQATGMNPDVSVHGRPKEPSPTPFLFRHAYLAVFDPDLFGLYWDVNMAFGVMQQQPPDSPRYGQLLYVLNEVVNFYAAEDPSTMGGLSAEARRGV